MIPLTVCAAGRWLRNPDQPGDLDWLNPCPEPADPEYEIPLKPATFAFCATHGPVITDRLYEVFMKPYKAQLVDADGNRIRCSAGLYIKGDHDGWRTPCPADTTEILILVGMGPHGLCQPHHATLDRMGLILASTDVATIAQNQ